MSKIDGGDVELSDADASLVKAMLQRGDKQHHIAAWFGVDSRAVSHIKNSKTHLSVEPANIAILPPPGPYRPDSSFVMFYQKMVEVNELWQAMNLRQAKALLEDSLRQPIMPISISDIEVTADDMFRNEFGLIDL